jgi:hypothetical protein
MDILPFLDIQRGSDGGPSPVGGYVRFLIERVPVPDPQVRRYATEHRDWLSRFFVGRSFARNLRARIVVNRTNVVTSTVTLASASFDSNRRQGQSWNTELNDRRFLTPYLRVDPGSTAAVEVTLAANTQVDSDITRNVLSIVEAGARLVAPTGPLVTSLTADRVTQASDFVDRSISALFNESIAERAQNDFAAEQWNAATGSYLAQVSAYFPMQRPMRDDTNLRNVGQWRIMVTPPVVSIFSDIPLHAPEDQISADCLSRSNKNGGTEQLAGRDRLACMAFTGLIPARVLNLQVGEDQTLGQALRGDAGIAAAQQRFAAGLATEAASRAGGKERIVTGTASELCGLIAERSESLGLNSYDAAAALWAFAWAGGLDGDVAHALSNGNTCPAARLSERLGLSRMPVSASPVPAPAAPQQADPVQ